MKRAVVLAILLASAAHAADKPPKLTPESDPDVLSAVHGLPAGATPAKQVTNVKPTAPRWYPHRSHFQVLLDGVVTEGGRVKVVSIRRSDDAAFAAACIRAAEKWQFEPARTGDGNPLAIWNTFACTLTIQ